ncbi:uncharacterized protein LOC110097154 [Dendrobium catenatum]|uniref:uncharacterized protein LOC110097154 n=1 Tax=Dendrobium catenatum TaxID=906689 RepID=UPI0009F2C2FF|nr:uncharacterized protein LOC110097154 [Dendrobium catenatum]
MQSNLAIEMPTQTTTDTNFALQAVRGRSRGRGRFSYNQNRGGRSPSPATRGGRRPRSSVQCQICNRVGHSAFQCWYRTDLNYQPVQQAFLSADAPSSDDWFLDTGATSHLTSNLQHLQTPQTYTGSSQIQVGNGQLLPIANSGQGLLPTPSRCPDQSDSSPRSMSSRSLPH